MEGKTGQAGAGDETRSLWAGVVVASLSNAEKRGQLGWLARTFLVGKEPKEVPGRGNHKNKDTRVPKGCVVGCHGGEAAAVGDPCADAEGDLIRTSSAAPFLPVTTFLCLSHVCSL